MMVGVPGLPVGEYPVHIEAGALDALPTRLAAHAPAHRYVVVTDTTVAGLHGERVLDRLRGAGVAADLLTVAPGESSKSAAAWAELVERIAALGAGRDACIVALGGGVVGDLAGFAAATFMRGVPFVQAPTTLLAMVDAAVGGKTGIDLRAGKNLVGAFHWPRLVVCDPLVLKTLPVAELRNGLAEAVKHGVIADAAYARRIAEAAAALTGGDAERLAHVVCRSVEIKAEFVAADPREAGRRAALNFGHTIGHALEAVTGYAIPHGEAVAIGMVAEARIGERAGVTEAGTASVLSAWLEAVGLPVHVPAGVDADALMGAATLDKKARAGRTRYTLLARAGAVARPSAREWTWDVDDAAVRAALGPDR